MTERIVGSDATVAVGRFAADGTLGFRAKTGGPVRETRAEAEADYRASLDARAGKNTASEPCPLCGQFWKVCDDCHARPEGEW